MDIVADAKAVRDDGTLQAFFKLLWEDIRLQRLFFCHRRVLFQHEGESPTISLPWLYYDNDAAVRDEDRAHFREAVGAATELRQAKTVTTQKHLRQPFEEALGDGKALACLLVLRFVRNNPALAHLLQGDDLTYHNVKAALAHEAPDLDVFSEVAALADGWEGGDDPPCRGDDGLCKALRRHAWAFREWIGGGAHTMLDFIDFGALRAPLYFQGRTHTDRLLGAIRQERDEYRAALRILWELQVVASHGAAFACPRCSPLFLTLTNSALGPSHLSGGCPRCGHELLGATAYALHPKVMEAVSAKDGMLAAAVAWLLLENQIEPRCGKYAGDYETDFRFQARGSEYLLECKMFRGDGTDDSVVENFAGAIAQAEKHAEAAHAKGEDVQRTFVVTNLPLARFGTQLEAAKRRRRASNVDVVDYEQLPQALKELGR